jgi:hypothetical protein
MRRIANTVLVGLVGSILVLMASLAWLRSIDGVYAIYR